MRDMIARINGLEINYEAYGSGPKLLLLHGWATNLHSFDKVSQALCQRFQVIKVDLPGFGLSQAPKETYGVFEYADFIEKFLEYLDVKEIFILGHSMGGAIALAYCSKYSRVKKLILEDSSGVRIQGLIVKTKILIFKLLKYISTPAWREYWKHIFGSTDYKNAGPMRKILIKVIGEDLRPILNSIRVPTLIIWGQNDKTTPPGEGLILRQGIKGAKIITLKDCDHFPHLEYPEKFSQIVKEFLIDN